jgi:MoaA/NifB/PqqE/SkfB family radical SAM enzyme
VRPTYRALYKRIHESFNDQLSHLAGGRLAHVCRPTAIMLVLTERCNARCVHCDIWKNRGREESPGLDGWKRAVTDLATWLGPVHVVFTGGEALLQPFTPELVEHGVRSGLFVELLTHGFWKDRSRLERAALANPWRITMSLDGIGETHSIVRGRENFWPVAHESLSFLRRLRAEMGLTYTIRLKTVLMQHNIHNASDVARYARDHDMEVLYQPIEQNYNTPDDPRWFEHAPTWPRDIARAEATVHELIRMKNDGYPIANSMAQLEIMLPYFRHPAELRLSVQAHAAPGRPMTCAAMTNLEVRANGDVRPCSGGPAVGNIKTRSIRDIWHDRPRWWQSGCCLDQQAAGSLSPGHLREGAAGDRESA